MSLTNSLFLDQQYKDDCEIKIDYLKIIESATHTTLNIKDVRDANAFYKQISESCYKELGIKSESTS